jgi:hypothetical protein
MIRKGALVDKTKNQHNAKAVVPAKAGTHIHWRRLETMIVEPRLGREKPQRMGPRVRGDDGGVGRFRGRHVAAMQSISISNGPNHSGTQTKIRAGGSFVK